MLTVGLVFVSIPTYYDYLVSLSNPDLDPATVRANLEASGISIEFYATYLLLIRIAFAIAWIAVGVVIFWRSDDWMALFTSLSLITFGTLGINDGPFLLAEHYFAIWLPVHLLGVFSTASLVLFFFLFPNGRFVPRWTRWMAVLWVAHEVAYYFFPGSFFDLDSSFPQIDFMVMVTFACVGAGSLLYRYRRVSGPTQRQQTKWVVFGTAVALLGAVGFESMSYVLPAKFQEGSLYALIIEAGVFGSLLLIPLSVGVAVLRYRLWDIDHIINRTLVYSILIATLSLVFFGVVTLLQGAFRVLTGEESELAIVASTLAIAGLFEPFRRRTHAFIDRRFYRRRYDARKTLEGFGEKLREETDLDAVSEDLVGVVRETMQPSHVSLWLRPETASHGEKPVEEPPYSSDLGEGTVLRKRR